MISTQTRGPGIFCFAALKSILELFYDGFSDQSFGVSALILAADIHNLYEDSIYMHGNKLYMLWK